MHNRACMLTSSISSVAQSKAYCFYRCKSRLLMAKVRANRGLAIKGVLPRAQHTHAPITPQAWAHFFKAHFRGGQAARVQYDPQTSVIAGGRATCYTVLSLPVLTDAVRRAIQSTRDTSATGDDGIGPLFSISMLFWAVLPTHRTMFWPPCSAVFFVLSCVQAMYQRHGR
jgi:hypothetical protein